MSAFRPSSRESSASMSASSKYPTAAPCSNSTKTSTSLCGPKSLRRTEPNSDSFRMPTPTKIVEDLLGDPDFGAGHKSPTLGQQASMQTNTPSPSQSIPRATGDRRQNRIYASPAEALKSAPAPPSPPAVRRRSRRSRRALARTGFVAASAMRPATAEPTIKPSAAGNSIPNVLRPADAKADADRQRRLLAPTNRHCPEYPAAAQSARP